MASALTYPSPGGLPSPGNPAAVAPKVNALDTDAQQAANVGIGNGPGHPHESLPASSYNPAQTYGAPPPTYSPVGGIAGTTLPGGPTGIEDNPYIANFQKSLAASRGAIAAQIAAAMHEIGTNEAAGRADVNNFGTSLGQMNTDEHNSLNALAVGADKAAAAGGLQSYTSAKATTNPLAAAGDMATHFAQGAVPLLQQGVGAQAQAQTNALQQEGLSLNAQLDQEMRTFDAQQASDIQQRNFAREQSYTGQQNALDLQTHSAALSQATSTNPLVAQQQHDQQQLLDKGGIDSFTADQIPALRQSPQYTFLKGIADPKQRAIAAADLVRAGHSNVTDLARLDGLIT